jgi:glycosyltransferase involved in cell wall biosynthesis
LITMKIAFLGGANTIHAVRWVNGLASRGHEVCLYSIVPLGIHKLDSRVRLVVLPFSSAVGYILNAFHFRRAIDLFDPDVVNVHYASGYGTLGMLSGCKRVVLSVWGADVYNFPDQNRLCRALVSLNLNRARWVTSTSRVMAQRTLSLMGRNKLSVVHFGVDTEIFAPEDKAEGHVNAGTPVVIGTVKTMHPKYGIDILLKAYSRLVLRKGVHATRLVIVGGGPDLESLKVLSKELGVEKSCDFVGAVAHAEVPKWLRKMDVFCALSRDESESFGVAAIEAGACGIPVVVSECGGLPEVVQQGRTGFVVPKEDPTAAAEALELLVSDPELRRKMGQYGRSHVVESYNWRDSLSAMEDVYRFVSSDR